MTHEFKSIVEQAFKAKSNGLKSVLASVVALDGSSYRKPGVRMLLLENGVMVGAVSGGCVEKEILLQAQTVFSSGQSKIMTYDGRYRLGCEGVLYILLELFQPKDDFELVFEDWLHKRKPFEIYSYYIKKEGFISGLGSFIKLNNEIFNLGNTSEALDKESLLVFQQKMSPCFKLVIVGAEHDAVQLCKYANLTGWQVTIISGTSDTKSIEDFPGATEFYSMKAEAINTIHLDNQTGVVLMTHNFANDLRFLVALKDSNVPYVGLLGPKRRREDLLTQFIEYCPDIDADFLERIHGPAGINIGAETPQEIAISILAELLSVTRNQEPIPLSKKKGDIHA